MRVSELAAVEDTLADRPRENLKLHVGCARRSNCVRKQTARMFVAKASLRV